MSSTREDNLTPSQALNEYRKAQEKLDKGRADLTKLYIKVLELAEEDVKQKNKNQSQQQAEKNAEKFRQLKGEIDKLKEKVSKDYQVESEKFLKLQYSLDVPIDNRGRPDRSVVDLEKIRKPLTVSEYKEESDIDARVQALFSDALVATVNPEALAILESFQNDPRVIDDRLNAGPEVKYEDVYPMFKAAYQYANKAIAEVVELVTSYEKVDFEIDRLHEKQSVPASHKLYEQREKFSQQAGSVRDKLQAIQNILDQVEGIHEDPTSFVNSLARHRGILQVRQGKVQEGIDESTAKISRSNIFSLSLPESAKFFNACVDVRNKLIGTPKTEVWNNLNEAEDITRGRHGGLGGGAQ